MGDLHTPVGGSARERVIRRLIDVIEGGYSNHQSDSGGKTRYGITEGYARRRGYQGEMRELPRELAERWYSEEWDTLMLDDVARYSERVAEEVFDTAINMGPAMAVKFLQRSLNALNRRQADFGDIAIDGGVGPRTIGALARFIAKRGKSGEVVLMRMLNSLQGERYIWLAEHREKDEAFIFGWFAQRVVM